MVPGWRRRRLLGVEVGSVPVGLLKALKRAIWPLGALKRAMWLSGALVDFLEFLKELWFSGGFLVVLKRTLVLWRISWSS